MRSSAHPDPAISAYGMSCSGLVLLVLDLVHTGSSMPPRSHSCLEPLLFIYGVTRVEEVVSVLDFVHMDLMMSPRGSSHPGSFLSRLRNGALGTLLASSRLLAFGLLLTT